MLKICFCLVLFKFIWLLVAMLLLTVWVKGLLFCFLLPSVMETAVPHLYCLDWSLFELYEPLNHLVCAYLYMQVKL